MMKFPEDFELLDFFGSEPIECEPQDGLFAYRFADQNGVTLVFSFHWIQASIQAQLLVNGTEIAVFCQEGAKRLSIENDAVGQYLCGYFEIDSTFVDAQIRVSPHISVKWSTLLDYSSSD